MNPILKRSIITGIVFVVLALVAWRTRSLLSKPNKITQHKTAKVKQKTKSKKNHKKKTKKFITKKVVAIQVVQPIYGKVRSYLEQTSTLEVTHKQKVYSQQSGIITFISIDVGDYLRRKGSLLLKLDARNILLNLQKAQADFQKTKEDFQREKNIADSKLDAQNLIRDARYAYQQKKILYEKSLVNQQQTTKTWKRTQKSYQSELVSETEYEEKKFQKQKIDLDTEKAKIEYLKAKNEWNRVLQLDQKKLIENTTLLQTRRAYELAKIELERAKLANSQMRIKSPMQGVVILKNVSVGDYITPNTHLFTIANLKKLEAKVSLPERELPNLKLRQTVKITLEAIQMKPLYGKVTKINPMIDSKSGTVEITITLPNINSALIKPGMFINAKIITNQRIRAILIPKRTILYQGKQKYIFVVQNEKAVKKIIKVGYEKKTLIEVLSGVAITDKIVTEGQFQLSSGSQVKILKK